MKITLDKMNGSLDIAKGNIDGLGHIALEFIQN
jgi:hypothetical protein